MSSTPIQKAPGVYIEMPLGKPSPTDPTARVPQAAQKGHTCGYYQMNDLRIRVKGASEMDFPQEREIEKIGSTWRKQCTAIDERHENVLKMYNRVLGGLAQALRPNFVFSGASDKIAKLALGDEERRVIEELFSQFQKDNLEMSLFKFIDHFIHNLILEDEEKNLEAYCTCHDAVLRHFGVDLITKLKQDDGALDRYNLISAVRSSKQNLTTYLKNLAHRTLSEHYGLQHSAWTPSSSCDLLVRELTEHGPLGALGFFGVDMYDKEPDPLKSYQIQDRNAPVPQNRLLVGWKGAQFTPRFPFHSVTVIGATTEGAKGGSVFYHDPLDPSDPQQPDLKKIYVISYERFQESVITDLGLATYTETDPKLRAVCSKKDPVFLTFGRNKNWVAVDYPIKA